MIFLIWLIFGSIVGWIASILMRSDDIILDIVVGLIGAFIGSWLLSPLFGVHAFEAGYTAAVETSVLGATILLGIVHIVRRL